MYIITHVKKLDVFLGARLMDNNMCKEQFSRAYVQAVAACAGFAWSIPSVDDDSIDMTLHERGGNGTIRSPRLELQLKCKAAQVPQENEVSYSIKLKNYEELREKFVLVPRILVVVIVPDDMSDWLEQSEEELVMRRCGYWVSLRGLPPSKNNVSQTIPIPRAQMFTVQSLQAIMQRISVGGLP